VHTCRKLERLTEAEEVLREIIRRHPDHAAARIQLAWVHEFRGQSELAQTLLEEAATNDPQNRQITETLVQILIRHNSFERAKSMVRDGLERSPTDVNWRQRAIRLLLDCGDQDAAVEAARAGVEVHPRGAYLWFLLATTLNQFRQYAQPGEIEGCFRRSLELNSALFDAADLLAVLLVEQQRYGDAEQIQRSIEPKLYDPSPAEGRLAWIHRLQGRQQEAREELASTIQQHPSYQWGWQLLLDWLLEDQAWDQTRALLGKIPEELRTVPQFRRQRLVVLEKAGLPVEELDAEWSELLHDFPQELPLHLIRYDLLQEVNRFAQAHAVLHAVTPSQTDDPYYLARLVETCAQEKKPDEAIANAQRIFFAEAEQNIWPADYAWGALKKAQYIDRAYDEARRSLEKQLRPTPRTFLILCSHALEQAKTEKVIPQSRWSTWFPDAGVKELLSLLNLADRSSWVDGEYRAKALDRLNDVGHYRLVIKYWKRYRGEVETDVATWAETGRALASLKQRKEARRLLSSWRTRRGVSMWVVANYVGCLSTFWKSGLKERVASPGDALRDLPHDHCARYLVHVRAEACALLGDTQALQDTWTQYRSYFDCNEKNEEWFQQGRRYLLTDIPMLVRYLQQNETGLYRRAVWGLRWRALWQSSGIRSGIQSDISSSLPIPWWLIWLLIWLAIQIFRNS
jgi:tetratricopeptide (TPR) repeat protein